MSHRNFAKYILGLCIGLALTLSVGAQAREKTPSQSKKASKLFLTYDETLYLNLEDRIGYFENALDYIVLYEKIQTKVFASDKEYAWLENINSFVDLLPKANAVGARTCICGTYAGGYYSKEKGCDTPSVSTKCGPGKFTCNPSLFTLKGNPTCIAAGGSCASRSNSCVTEFRNQRNQLGMTQEELNAWAQDASKGLSSLNSKAFGNSRVEEHCASRPNDKDCLALKEIEKDIQAQGAHVATAQERTAAQLAAYDAKKDALDGGNGDNSTPKGLPGANEPVEEFPPAPVSGQPQPINPGGGCVNQLSANLGALSCVACGLAAADGEAASQGVSEF
ncbi:MAG: hypothetical protein GW917_03215, partial [Bdellovibrionales bacterium]|nr:hypothetical protein [Bdellovibrionales bacterium]